MAIPTKLIEGFRGTASLPIIYLKLHEAINDPYSSLSKVSAIISDDAGLSARLLKLVNSSFYGFPQRIETISDAVSLVGSKQVRDLALVTTMMKAFQGIPEDLIDMEMFWMHSMACGVGAKVISEMIGESQIERYFVAGVLHDLGRLIMYSKVPNESRIILERAKNEHRPMVDIEYDVLDCSHTEIGRALVDAWKLPSCFQEVVAYHHTPEKAQQYPIETAAVHIADIVVHALQYGTSGERFVPCMKKESWHKLNLSIDELPKLVRTIERDVESVVHLLQSEVTV